MMAPASSLKRASGPLCRGGEGSGGEARLRNGAESRED